MADDIEFVSELVDQQSRKLKLFLFLDLLAKLFFWHLLSCWAVHGAIKFIGEILIIIQMILFYFKTKNHLLIFR